MAANQSAWVGCCLRRLLFIIGSPKLKSKRGPFAKLTWQATNMESTKSVSESAFMHHSSAYFYDMQGVFGNNAQKMCEILFKKTLLCDLQFLLLKKSDNTPG